MENKIIKNKVTEYYRVKVGEELYVSSFRENSRAEITSVNLSKDNYDDYNNVAISEKIADFVGGKVVKHRRTEIITEIIEEVE